MENPSTRSKARCLFCRKSFDVSNMGEAAVISHMAGKKHRSLVAARKSTPSVSNYSAAGGSAVRVQLPVGESSVQGVVQPDVTDSSAIDIRQFAGSGRLSLAAEVQWRLMLSRSITLSKATSGLVNCFALCFLILGL